MLYTLSRGEGYEKYIFTLLATAALAACSSSGITYRPTEQKLPQYIKRISVRPFTNKTPQFGLEEKLTLKVIDEFLKNGEYLVSPENAAQGVIVGEISHYILTPIQYDVNLVPTVYKLNVYLRALPGQGREPLLGRAGAAGREDVFGLHAARRHD